MSEKITFSDFKVNSLTIYNFLSIQELEITFSKVNTLLLTGENGSGKSSILSALVFNLYGKVFDRGNYTQSDLISNNSKPIDSNILKIYNVEKEKPLLLTIGRYSLKNKPLVVIRGLMKKGKAFLKVFYDNKDFEYKDYSVMNSQLEKLLTISSNDFKSNSYFHSDIYMNIISLTNKPKQLMDILNSIFNLDKLNILHEHFNGIARKTEQKYNNVIDQYLVAKENAKYFQKHLNEVINTLKTEIKSYEEKLENLKNSIIPNKDKLKEIENKLNNIKKGISDSESSQRKFELKQNKLKEEKYALNKSVEWLKNKINNMSDSETTECSMCHSIITKNQLQLNYESTISKNNKILEKISSDIVKYQQLIDKLQFDREIFKKNYDKIFSEYNDLKNKIYTDEKNMEYYKKEILDRKAKIQKQQSIKSNNEIMIKYRDLSINLVNLFKENLKYSPMRNIFNYNSELKIQIFMYYLKLLNKLMIKYANLLKQEYSPKFVVDKNNKIKLILMKVSEYNESMYLETILTENTIYENLLSQGEKKKQNIIVIFAFIEFMLFYNFNKKHLGILLLDELSVNLDDKSIQIFYDAIANLASLYDLQIIVSCHELYPRDFETKNYINTTFDLAYSVIKTEKGTELTQII